MPTAKPARRTTNTRTTPSREERPRPGWSPPVSALPVEAVLLPVEGLGDGRPWTDVAPTDDPLRLATARLVHDRRRRIGPRAERAREDDPAQGQAEPADRGLERQSEGGRGRRSDVVDVHPG